MGLPPEEVKLGLVAEWGVEKTLCLVVGSLFRALSCFVLVFTINQLYRSIFGERCLICTTLPMVKLLNTADLHWRLKNLPEKRRFMDWVILCPGCSTFWSWLFTWLTDSITRQISVFFRTLLLRHHHFVAHGVQNGYSLFPLCQQRWRGQRRHGVRNYICHHGHHLYCNGCIDVGGKSKHCSFSGLPAGCPLCTMVCLDLPWMHILRWFMPDFDWREDRFDFLMFRVANVLFTVFFVLFFWVAAAFVAFNDEGRWPMDRHQQRTGLCVFEQPSGQSSRFSGHGSRDVEDETCSQPGSGQRYSEVFVATCHHHSGRQHQSKHCCASAAVLLEGSIESKNHQWHLQCRCKAGHLAQLVYHSL